MTQPKFAPIAQEDEVRPSYRLDPPAPWTGERPGEFRHGAPALRGGGVPGPDQGYALGLAERLRPRLVLAEGEHAEDVLGGAVAIGLRRASLFGRAPVLADLEVALDLFGFLAPATTEVVAKRKAQFFGLAHSYPKQRAIADSIDEDVLRAPRPARAS